MILYIMTGLLVLLDIIILVKLVREDTTFRKLQKTVEFKKLQLNERAIDLQMGNTQGYIDSMIEQGPPAGAEGNPNEEEERVPVGFKQENTK